MKAIPWITILILSASCVAPTIAAPDLGLPELHKIQRVTLSPNFGCRSEQDALKGYENTALFLSAYSHRMNSPELLFNGACKSADWFEAATAGDDLDVVADYGEWPIEDLIAQQVFSPRSSGLSVARPVSGVFRVRVGYEKLLLIRRSETVARFPFCPRIKTSTDSLSHPMNKVLQAKRWGCGDACSLRSARHHLPGSV